MKGCLLCLELKKEFVDAIVIKSNQWNELNIKLVLDKYLWPMNHIDTSSWICIICWTQLYEFHKFYMRIGEVHKDFGLLSSLPQAEKNNSNNEENPVSELEGSQMSDLAEISHNELDILPVEELKEILNEYKLSNDDVERDVIMGQKPLIINDSQELIAKNPLVQKRKRGRPRKNSLYDTNLSIIASNKTKKYEKQKTKVGCHATSYKKQNKAVETSRKKIGVVKNDDAIKENNSEMNCENNFITTLEKPYTPLEVYNDSHNDTDRESLDHNENKSSINTYCPPKTNHNEKDKFLKENFKIKCFLCNIPFETFFNMRKHFDEHHKERGHVKCCNKKFYRRSILVDHVHYHLNPNYFKCSQCGKVMADRRCLELHVEMHDSNNEKNHFCDICGKGFAKLGVLKKHRMIHLSEEEKRFSCADCGKNFASNYLLSSHYRSVHLKKYAKICDICGKSIRCKDVFERHMLQHEGKTVPSVSCDVCGLVLTDKKALKRHKDVIHPIGGQHEYTCSICSKTSPNLRAHKRHVQYKHMMGYDYKCTICEKAFKRAPTLKEHMASHTGTILYTCPWCPKTFNSNANMHNHRKRVHPKEWEEASRKRYSGNLPPNYKPPNTAEIVDYTAPLES